jgi:hypothetical protein
MHYAIDQENFQDLLAFFRYHSTNNIVDDKMIGIQFGYGFFDRSDISDFQLLDVEISKFFTSLATNTHIKQLRIEFSNPGPAIFNEIILFNKFVSGIKGNQTLETLEILVIANADMELFFDNLETTNIKKLSFYTLVNCDFSRTERISNHILELMFSNCKSEYVSFIANALKNNKEKNIQKFSIRNVNLGYDEIEKTNDSASFVKLIDVLSEYRNLKILNLDYCRLGNPELRKIAEMLQKKIQRGSPLEELRIVGNEFYDFEIFLEIWSHVEVVYTDFQNLLTTSEKLQKLKDAYGDFKQKTYGDFKEFSKQNKKNIWSQCTVLKFNVEDFLFLTVNYPKSLIAQEMVAFPFTGEMKRDQKFASVIFEGNEESIVQKYNQVMDHFMKLVVHNPIIVQSANKNRTQKLFDITNPLFKNRLEQGCVNLMAASEKSYRFCEVGATRSQNKTYCLNEKMALDALKTGLNPYTQIKIKPCHPEDPEIEALVEKMIENVKINEGDAFLQSVETQVQKTSSFLEKNSLKRTFVGNESQEKVKKQKTALMVSEIQDKKKEILFNKTDCENQIFDLSAEALRIFRMWKQDVFTMGKVFFHIPPHVSAEFARTRPCHPVVLYRGMSWREKKQLKDFLKSKTYEKNNHGQKEIWVTNVYHTFHSWTFDFFIAKNFAEYDGNDCGIVFESHFEPEDVVIDFTKLRSYNIMNSEKEILVRPMKVTCKIIEIIKDGMITYEDNNIELVSFLEEGTESMIKFKIENMMKKNFDPNTIVHNLPFYWHLMIKDWGLILNIVASRIDITKNTNFKNSSLVARLIDFLENESEMGLRDEQIVNIEKNFKKIYKTPEARRIVFQESGDHVHCWFLNQHYEKRYDFIFNLFDANMNGESVEEDAQVSFLKKFVEPLKIDILVNSPDLYEAVNETFMKFEEKPFDYEKVKTDIFSITNEVGKDVLGLNFETEFQKYFGTKSDDLVAKFINSFNLKTQTGKELYVSNESGNFIKFTLDSIEYEENDIKAQFSGYTITYGQEPLLLQTKIAHMIADFKDTDSGDGIVIGEYRTYVQIRNQEYQNNVAPNIVQHIRKILEFLKDQGYDHIYLQ